jgi:hypothetical protein
MAYIMLEEVQIVILRSVILVYHEIIALYSTKTENFGFKILRRNSEHLFSLEV